MRYCSFKGLNWKPLLLDLRGSWALKMKGLRVLYFSCLDIS